MKGTGSDGVQGQVELIVPTEFETGLGQGIVTVLGTRQSLCEIGCVGGNLVGNNASLDVVTIGKSQVLLGSHIAQHGGSQGSDIGGTNGTGNMVVSGSHVGGQRDRV